MVKKRPKHAKAIYPDASEFGLSRLRCTSEEEIVVYLYLYTYSYVHTT